MSAAPRLLHVFSTFVPAGPETRTARLVRALGRRADHAILAIDGRTEATRLLEGCAARWRLVEPPARAGSLSTVLRLRRLLAREPHDLILTYNWGAFDAVMAAWTRGEARRVVHHEDGFNEDEAEGQLPRRVRARRFFLPKVAQVVVPSANLRAIAGTHWRLPPERVSHLPNGIDLAPFAPADGAPALRAELGIPRDAVVLGTVGHLRAVKNIPRLLRAVAPLLRERADLHVVLVGDGAEREHLSAQCDVAPWRGRVHFAGHRADPAPWYRVFDLFLITSDSEQMPVSLLEAMASSLPVVSTDVGDVRVMLPGEQAGGLVPLGDEQERIDRQLAARIRVFLEDRESARELGAQNRQFVEERYSFQAMLDGHVAVWERALGRPLPGAASA